MSDSANDSGRDLENSYDPDNIFAKIIRGELPAFKVYEDEHTLAFMDIMPQVEGHTLVIPKAGGANIFDLSDEALRATITTTKKVASAVKQAFSAEGIMIAQLNGSAAGQTVFHLHFHVLPRNAGIELGLHNRLTVDHEVLAKHAEQIRAALETAG